MDKGSITEDCWTAANGQAYLGQTAVFVDEQMKPQHIMTGVFRITGSHTAENITKCSNALLKKSGISSAKVVSVTHDRGPIGFVSLSFIHPGANQLKAARSEEHAGESISCAAHGLNIAVKKALAESGLDSDKTKEVSVVQSEPAHITCFRVRCCCQDAVES